MRTVSLITIFLGLWMTCIAQSAQVTFTVQSEFPLRADDQVFITGNHQELGAWHPSSVPLTPHEGTWSGTFTFAKGTQLEYKLTKGSWQSEAMTHEGRVPPNFTLTVEGDTMVHHVIPFWRDSVFNTAPHISGDYRVHDDFPVDGLIPRRVIVWLPPSYAQDTGRSYPVLYLHDGQNVFDPHTSTLGYDWRVDEIVDSLIRAGDIEEVICVAVYCNPDVRAKEYSDDPDLGKKYQQFMAYQLKPWIDSVYRTKPDREHTAVMGASMGGLISFILAWEYPDIFSKAACMSPAFRISIGQIGVDYVSSVEMSHSAPTDITVYIDNGTLDLEALLQPGIDDMMQVLDARGTPYTWFLDDGAPHNERAWSARVWRPLLQFFGM